MRFPLSASFLDSIRATRFVRPTSPDGAPWQPTTATESDLFRQAEALDAERELLLAECERYRTVLAAEVCRCPRDRRLDCAGCPRCTFCHPIAPGTDPLSQLRREINAHPAEQWTSSRVGRAYRRLGIARPSHQWRRDLAQLDGAGFLVRHEDRARRWYVLNKTWIGCGSCNCGEWERFARERGWTYLAPSWRCPDHPPKPATTNAGGDLMTGPRVLNPAYPGVVHATVSAEALASPETWVLAGTYRNTASAKETATRIQRGLIPAYQPLNSFDARTAPTPDATELYVMYIPTDAPAVDGER